MSFDNPSLTNKLQTNMFEPKLDDDFSDRLNYRYTTAFLIFFSILVTFRQYSSEVIICWLPAHFTSNYVEYASHICWVHNTYYVHMNESIPTLEVDKMSEIKYYQWISLFLVFQALIFYIPRMVWCTFSDQGGLYIGDLISAAIRYKRSSIESSDSYMNYLVNNIDRYVDDKRRHLPKRKLVSVFIYAASILPCFGKFSGSYLTLLYISVKVTYLLNSALQIYVTSVLLGQNFIYLGLDFIKDFLSNHDYLSHDSKYFPRVTLCDFMIREIGNPNKSHRYTVQCVLPINLLNQQIFTAIWFWYLILTFFNVVSLFKWARRCFPDNAIFWIKGRIYLFNELVVNNKLQNRFEHFINHYLKTDGIFIIRLIAANSSDYVATDLIHQLWCQHDQTYGHYFPNEPHSINSSKCSFSHQKIEEKFLMPILRRACDRKKPRKTVKLDLTENYHFNRINHEYVALSKINDSDVPFQGAH